MHLKKDWGKLAANPLFFYALLCVQIFLVFFLNSNHTNQQYIFLYRYIPLANNLIHGNGYTLNGVTPAFYPIWGYSLFCSLGLTIGYPIFTTLFLQGLLTLVGVLTFYKISEIAPKIWHLILFLPFISLMSVRWPDAIVAVLLLMFSFCFIKFLVKPQWIDAILGGLVWGITLNFRSEYIYFPFVAIAIIVVFYRKYLIRTITFCSITLLSSIIFMLPWAIRSDANNAGFRTGATNGGLVLFTSLGQLPHNPWDITPTDQYGEEVVKSHGINDPYSPQGDSVLVKAFVEDIYSKPISFAEKVGYNFASIFLRGLYVGEYSRFFMENNVRDSTESSIKEINGISNKAIYLKDLDASISLPYLFEKIIQFLFIIFFSYILLSTIIAFFRNISTVNSGYILPLYILVIYKIVLVSFIQYEPRHMNSIYMLVLILFLVNKYKKTEKFTSHVPPFV